MRGVTRTDGHFQRTQSMFCALIYKGMFTRGHHVSAVLTVVVNVIFVILKSVQIGFEVLSVHGDVRREILSI